MERWKTRCTEGGALGEMKGEVLKKNKKYDMKHAWFGENLRKQSYFIYKTGGGKKIQSYSLSLDSR